MAEQKEENSKWPWSVTDREFGALEQEVKELRHDFRNLRMIVENSGVSTITKQDVVDTRESLNNLHTLKAKRVHSEELRYEFNQFKTKVYTILSMVVVLAGLVGWLIDTVLKIAKN